MKFKVGDKIKHKEFGIGKIVYINEEEVERPYAVRFETFNEYLHNLGIYGAPEVKNGHGWWCEECELELVKQQPQNLIPLIAKELGVEIGERFKISKNSDVFEFTKDKLIGIDSDEVYNALSIFFELITGKKKIIKLPQKPLLTEDEKAILRNMPKKYKYIARDYYGALYIYEKKPKKCGHVWFRVGSDYSLNNLSLFQRLFQFIKWEDKEPYKIKELLKE